MPQKSLREPVIRQNQDMASSRHNDAAEKLCLRMWIYITDSSEVATFEITLPERNIAPARKPTKVTRLVFQLLFFRCYVRFREGKSRWDPSNRLANSYVLHLTFGSLCLKMSLPKHLEFWCEFRCRVCPINPQLSNLNGCVLLQVLLVRCTSAYALYPFRCSDLRPGDAWAPGYYILRPGLTNSFPVPFSFQNNRLYHCRPQ